MSDATARDRMNTDPASSPPVETRPIEVGASANKGVGLWGVMCLIATEGVLFAYLLFSYYYTASQLGPAWSPEPRPSLALALPNTAVLLLSSVFVWWGEGGVRKDSKARQITGLAIGVLLGAIFVTVQAFEWHEKTFTIRSSPYGSLYVVITGFHMVHVLVGLTALALTTVWSGLGYFSAARRAPITIVSYYWHFVDAVWLAVFFTFYLSPYLW